MPLSPEPFAPLRFVTVNGRQMAYVDEGEGDAIVFQHGNPTSSYLWRNVMPHCRRLGRRLVACDLIGISGSDKIRPAGPGTYDYGTQRDFLFALWDRLDLGSRVVLVLHDWGSALGFDWATRHPERVAGIAYMEAIGGPMTWEDRSASFRETFEAFRSDDGEMMVLRDNLFVEKVLPESIVRALSEPEMQAYRAPFAQAGEDRWPTLEWPRSLPIEGQPSEVAEVVARYAGALAASDFPKLFINAEPGSLLTGRLRKSCRAWPNQTEVTVRGRHFVQEDSADEIGAAIADFVARLDNGPA